jgi:hypothetical protein
MSFLTNQPKESSMPEPEIRILKTATGPSLSGKSTLTYNVGCDADKAIYLRIFANTGKGMFGKQWLALATLGKLLAKIPPDDLITSGSLLPAVKGASVNTAGFLLAALKNEGLVQDAQDNRRGYVRNEPGEFLAGMQALMASGVTLSESDGPTQGGSKKPAKVGIKTPAKAGAKTPMKKESRKVPAKKASAKKDSPLEP